MKTTVIGVSFLFVLGVAQAVPRTNRNRLSFVRDMRW